MICLAVFLSLFTWGTTVSYAGEQLGTVGKTGNSTGFHLHFEACREGAAVDPLSLIPDYRGVEK